MKATVVSLVAIGIVATIGAATAAPVEKPTPKACPEDKVWSESQQGCICAPGRRWNDTTRKCDFEPDAAAPRPLPDAGARPAESARPPDPPRRNPDAGTTCPEGTEWKNAFDACVPICPDGYVLDFKGLACHPVKIERRR